MLGECLWDETPQHWQICSGSAGEELLPASLGPTESWGCIPGLGGLDTPNRGIEMRWEGEEGEEGRKNRKYVYRQRFLEQI